MAVKDIQNLEYEYLGTKGNLRQFAQQFSLQIKQKDRTLEDAERIAKNYMDAVYAAPADFIPQLLPQNQSHARYFLLPDGTVFNERHPFFDSPEYETQKGLFMIYQRVLGKEGLDGFLTLLEKGKDRSGSEESSFREMEKTVSASQLMQASLENNAEKINNSRNISASSVADMLRKNNDIHPAEKAVILKGVLTYGLLSRTVDGAPSVSLQRLSFANDLQPLALSGEEAVRIAESIRKGDSFKDAAESMLESRRVVNHRSVPAGYNGWKVYTQSPRMEDAAVLNMDAAGTGWCTGGAVSTAQSHLSGGDFHIYFRDGEPLIAIRTLNGRMAEPPRGAHPGQFCTQEEENIAFDYISKGKRVKAGDDYVSDIQEIRKIMSPSATWRTVFDMPAERRYENGEFGGDTKSWGPAVERRIRELLNSSKAEVIKRHEQGYFHILEISNEKDFFGKHVVHGDIDLRGMKTLSGKFSLGKVSYKANPFNFKVDIIVEDPVTLNASDLEIINGGFFAYAGIINMPKLKKVTNFVSVLKDAELHTDLLTDVGTINPGFHRHRGNYVSVRESAKWSPASLEIINGGCYIHNKAKVEFPKLNYIDERLSIHYDAEVIANNLKEVGSGIYLDRFSHADLQNLSRAGIGEEPLIFIRQNATGHIPLINLNKEKQINTLQDMNFNETIQTDSTLAYGVELTSSPRTMRDEYKAWLAEHPGGIVAYRIFGDKTFRPYTVQNGIIGNPFDWTKLGSEGKATELFYEWLHTGNNFDEPSATEDFRQAIVKKLLDTPVGTPILYYKDIGRPSHATVLGYFVEHKDQLCTERIEKSVAMQQELFEREEVAQQAVPVGKIDQFRGETRYLSNFWPSNIILDGVVYPTVEHAYQAAKCVDPAERQVILELPVSDAKKKGRDVKMREDWDEVKDTFMMGFVAQKFISNPELRDKLLATAGAELIEGNGWGDTYWGVDSRTGQGENRLGKILMDVRRAISASIERNAATLAAIEGNDTVKEACKEILLAIDMFSEDLMTPSGYLQFMKHINSGLALNDSEAVKQQLLYHSLDTVAMPSFEEQAAAEVSQADALPVLRPRSDGPVIEIVAYEDTMTRAAAQGPIYKDNILIYTDNTDRDSGKNVISRDSRYYQKYGDGVHDLHYPTVTTAVLRGLDNAMPVSTQRYYHSGAKGVSGRWKDENLAEFKAVVGKEFEEIRREMVMKANAEGRTEPVRVYIPNKGDGFANGKISAITEVRTPRLYAFLQDQTKSLQFAADLYKALFVDRVGNADDIRKAALTAMSYKAQERGELFSPTEANLFADMSDDELRTSVVFNLPAMPEEERKKIFEHITGANEAAIAHQVVSDSASLTPDTDAVKSLSQLTAYEIEKLLREVDFPAPGVDQEFDAAASLIEQAIAPGWAGKRTPEQAKTYLVNCFASLPGSIQNYILSAIPGMGFFGEVFGEKKCDVYTIGFSTKTRAEFEAALPPGTKTIIDIRNYPYSRTKKEFNKNVFDKDMEQSGVNVVYLSEKSETLVKDLRELILANPGHVVIMSGTSQPSQCSRGQLIGPMLEQAGISVGHIRQGFDDKTKTWKLTPSVVTQEELTTQMLASKGKYIANGSFRNVVFNEDGSFTGSAGVVLRDKERIQKDRNIVGNWNNGAPVAIKESDPKSTHTPLHDAVQDVAKQSTFTFFITRNAREDRYTADDRATLLALNESENNKYIPVHFPEKFAEMRHELSDMVEVGQITPDEMEKRLQGLIAAECKSNEIRDKIGRFVMAQSEADRENFDPNNLVAGFVGANIARLCNRGGFGKVTEQELDGSSSYVTKEGFEGHVLVEQVNITQDDITEFCRLLIKESTEGVSAAETQRKTYDIKGVVALGETGAGLGAALAAQQLHMDSITMQCMRHFQHTLDNETLCGFQLKPESKGGNRVSVSDVRASLVNHLHMGTHNAPTKDELLMQIDHVLAVGEKRDTPGLTDRQMLTLHRLGFDNRSLLIMAEQAAINNVIIKEKPYTKADGETVQSCAADLMNHIEMCGGYGVEMPSEFSLRNIVAAEANVEKILNNNRRNGIGVITIANPLYPARLRSFDGFKEVEETGEVYIDNGVASAGVKRTEYTEMRPAVLFFRGNIEALSIPTVAVVSEASSPDASVRAASIIGKKLGEEGVTVAAAFRPMQNVSHTTHVSGEDILPNTRMYFKGNDQFFRSADKITQEAYSKLSFDEKKYRVASARFDSASAALNAAISAGSTGVVVSPNWLTYKKDEDQIQKVVRSGGIVLSEARFESGEGNNRLFKRAGHLACALGGSAILLDGRDEDNEMSPAKELVSARDGVSVVRYPDAEMENDKLQGNFNLSKGGADTLSPTAEDLQPVIDRVRFSSNEAVLESEPQAQAQEPVAVKTDKHVDRYRFYVVRRGNEQVFVIPETYPDVREAVRLAYGDNVKFSDDLGMTQRNMNSMARMVDGESVMTFSEYTGTQPMNPPVYSAPLYYDKGEIYSLFNAPNGTAGLIPLKKRIENKELLDYFISLINPIRDEFNEALGLPKDKTFRFTEASYLVPKPVGLDAYEGTSLRAKIGLLPNGSWCIKSFEPLRNDLYNEFFSADPYGDSKTDSEKEEDAKLNGNRTFEKPLIAERHFLSILNGTASLSAKKVALKELADTFKEWTIGIDGTSENLEVAEKDIQKGCEKGILSMHGGEDYDRRDAFAAITVEEKRNKRDLIKAKKDASVLEKKLMDAEAKRDAAYSANVAPSELIELDRDVEMANTELSALQERILRLYQQIGIYQMEKEKVILAERVSVVREDGAGKARTVTLCADGFPVTVKPGNITSKIPWEDVDKGIAEIHEKAKSDRESFISGIEKVENNAATLESIGKDFDRRHAESRFGTADKKEIVIGSFKNGRYIIERDGKKAYADEQLNIRSEFFDDLKPWGGRHGLATRDGKYNFIDAAGEPIVEVWFDSRSKSSEGLFVIKTGDDFGLIGGSGKLIGDRLFSNARDCHDGWCLVQGKADDPVFPGKFNYINASGELLFPKKGLDEASDFKDGVATVVIRGSKVRIDKSGKKVDGLGDGDGAGGGRAPKVSKGKGK